MPLHPFDPAQAALVASWAAGDAEVIRAWISIEADAVPADVVAGWSEADDVVAFMFRIDEESPYAAYGELWLDDEEGEVELARLLVAPDHRGRGIGRVLVRELVDRARRTHPELPDVILRVQPRNHRAIRAYHAAGFVDVPESQQASWNVGQRHVYHWMVMPAVS